MHIEDTSFVLNNKKWYKRKWTERFNEKEEKKYY